MTDDENESELNIPELDDSVTADLETVNLGPSSAQADPESTGQTAETESSATTKTSSGSSGRKSLASGPRKSSAKSRRRKATTKTEKAGKTGTSSQAESDSPGLIWSTAIVLLVLTFSATALGLLWNSKAGLVRQQPEYWMLTDQMQVSPAPKWIRTDVKEQVLRSAGLPERLSVLEAGLGERLSQAFALHPWVAEVRQVAIGFPASIAIELVYRRPVLMVEVPGGLYPVSSEGVLLPTGDFSPNEAMTYPRLGGLNSVPAGPVGASWGDHRINAAARLGEFLKDHWQRLSLARITLERLDVTADPQTPPEFLLSTQSSRHQIRWGHAPGQETKGERTAEAKLRRLVDFLESSPQTTLQQAQIVDIRSPQPR